MKLDLVSMVSYSIELGLVLPAIIVWMEAEEPV